MLPVQQVRRNINAQHKSYYYKRDGTPYEDTEENKAIYAWGKDFEDLEKRIVKQEHIGRVFISTVWMGLDHGLGWSDKPLIFETMIFGGEYDGYQERYTTEDEARAGHHNAVEMLNHSKNPCRRLKRFVVRVIRYLAPSERTL